VSRVANSLPAIPVDFPHPPLHLSPQQTDDRRRAAPRVEEKMIALKELKLELYKALLDAASAAGRASLSKDDFDFLLIP
jgi:hypothetical protein